MAMKQCKRFKRFMKEKFMPSKKVDGKEDFDDAEFNTEIEGRQRGDEELNAEIEGRQGGHRQHQGTQTQKRQQNCDEVYQDLGLCLRDCVIEVEKNRNKSDSQTGTL